MHLIDYVKTKVPVLHSAKSIEHITKGFSFEEKWKVITNNDEELFIKIYKWERSDHARSIYQYLEYFHQIGVILQKPIQFLEFPDEKLCLQILSWAKGLDGEEILKELSSETQYSLGVQSGKELLKLHTFIQPDSSESWEDYRIQKYNKYIEAFNESTYSFPEIKQITNFVEQNKEKLKNRPNCFLHDDFHPANLLFSNDKLTAVIDFDRFDWGDPYHDFHKVALFTRSISEPFAIGQIHGYFNGEPPVEFWTYYALYAAMIIPSDIVWSHKTTPHLIDGMWKRVYKILEDHDHFNRVIPNWYRTYKKSSLC